MLTIAYEFNTPSFTGFVRPAGPMHGLVIAHDAQGQTITDPGKCFFNLEHYTAANRCGLFIPRTACQHSYTTGLDWVEISFSPADEWPVSARLRYILRPAGIVDAVFRFNFLQDLAGFEAFVASYMPGGTSPPLIRIAGDWRRPEIPQTPREQLFIVRDSAALARCTDGRWQPLFDRGYAYRVLDDRYDLPVIVTTVGPDHTGPAIIQMVEAQWCSALSPNRFAPAHDFSLIGCDARSGQEISAKVRLIYRQRLDLSEVESLYHNFENEEIL